MASLAFYVWPSPPVPLRLLETGKGVIQKLDKFRSAYVSLRSARFVKKKFEKKEMKKEHFAID